MDTTESFPSYQPDEVVTIVRDLNSEHRDDIERGLRSVLDAVGTDNVNSAWLRERLAGAFPDVDIAVEPDPDAPRIAQSLDEIPWFPDVLAKAKADLAATPEWAQPSWYRNHIAETEHEEDNAHG